MRKPTLAALEIAALQARDTAYAPYSKFTVGAALESTTGEVFTGCNVENISFGLTVCAERNAIFSAVANGFRKFKRIVIVADSTEPISPCGACRQVLSEFTEEMEIVSVNLAHKKFCAALSKLLPRPKTGILDQCRST